MCADTGTSRADVRVSSAALETINRANADWLRAMKVEDTVAIAEPFDETGVFVTAAGQSVVGPRAIAALMRDRFAQEGRVVNGEIVQDGVMQVGSMVYEWGHVDIQLQGSGASSTRTTGRYLTVWASGTDGRWRIIRNLSLPYTSGPDAKATR